MSRSQIGQDLFVIDYYRGKKGGFFVDIGAGDGSLFSNTYLLEKKYNYKGICIEPLPNQYNQLIRHRNVSCLNIAVYKQSENNTVKFTIDPDYLLSGITDHRPPSNNQTMEILVHTKTLTQILDEEHAPRFIEYISIDTEGSEYIILQTLDFAKYKFGLVNVEHNYDNQKRLSIKELLEANGYRFLREMQWDDFYQLV